MRSWTRVASVCTALLIAGVGCQYTWELDLNWGKGSIIVDITETVSRSTIEPPLSMVIATYDIVVTGPGQSQSATIVVDGETVVFQSLDPGTWTVTMDGKNVDEIIVGSGSATAVVERRRTTPVAITVVPLPGDGTLELVVSWPENILADPAIYAELNPVGGTGEDISSTFVIDTSEDPNTAAYSGSWSAGDYELLISLGDGAAIVWGPEFFAVRVIDGQVTVGESHLSETDLYLNTGIERVANHTVVHELWSGAIPQADILLAKSLLHIGYGHTSHGSQLSTGMTGLVAFANNNLGLAYSENLFVFNSDGSGGALHLLEGSAEWLDGDLGDSPAWETETREFLDANTEYNVIMWSWCTQVSDRTEEEINQEYLTPMALIEADYPDVVFVYMTGRIDGSGEDGNLHQRNEQIRTFCVANDKWLYDFADIESYDPDGNYYLDRKANDECWYDSTGDGDRDKNWALAWQGLHSMGVEWFWCTPAHTQAVNGNMKAYAAWWLFTQIAKDIATRI